jgi:hypothetical protein
VLTHLKVDLYNVEDEEYTFDVSGVFRALLQNENSKMRFVEIVCRPLWCDDAVTFICDDEFTYLMEGNGEYVTIRWSPQIRQNHIQSRLNYL